MHNMHCIRCLDELPADWFGFCHTCRAYVQGEASRVNGPLPHELEPMPNNVEYIGSQRDLDEKLIFFLYNDNETGTTFTVAPGGSLNVIAADRRIAFHKNNIKN